MSVFAVLPVPFKDDDELRRWIGLPPTAEADAMVAKMGAKERAEMAHLRAVEASMDALR